MLGWIPRCLVLLVGQVALGPILGDALRSGRLLKFASALAALGLVGLVAALFPRRPAPLALGPTALLALIAASAIGSYGVLRDLQAHLERLIGG